MQRIRLGTRGSPLALYQANMVRAALMEADAGLDVEIIPITTSGDWTPAQGEKPLDAAQGGKALFAKEIQAALLAGEIDAAVHSMKDMETAGPDGLVIPWMMKRETPLDALIVSPDLPEVHSLHDLPPGCVVGTSSVRRGAFLKAVRPDLQITGLRGNVHTRLEKLKAGQVQATILAAAGLKRLGIENEIRTLIPADEMLPSAGQGAVGIEIREIDQNKLSVFSQISDLPTVQAVTIERAVLAALDGSCRTPIGAYAKDLKDGYELEMAVVSPDGAHQFKARHIIGNSPVLELAKIGHSHANALKNNIPSDLYALIFGQGKVEGI